MTVINSVGSGASDTAHGSDAIEAEMAAALQFRKKRTRDQ
jgi:hypothetical protein